MHIGLVLPSVPGYSETFFRSKINGLQKNGFRVTLFVKNPRGARDFICPVKVHPMMARNSLLRLLQTFLIFIRLWFIAPIPTLKIMRISRQRGYGFMASIKAAVIGSAILPEKLDWLHFGFATTAVEREFVGRAVGAKTAVSLRGYDIAVYPIKNPLCYKYLWLEVNKVHTISNDLVELAYKDGLPGRTAVSKITPAINSDNFARAQKKNREQIKPILLTVGRLHWKKGFEYTLEALAILRKRDVNFTYQVVGDGEETERIRFAAHQLGLSDCIEFKGKVAHKEMPQLMNKAEIYIQYSIQEGFCNAVLEAQASEMLCVVSDAEGLSENVLHNHTGWVVPKRNPAALAQKLEEVLQLPEVDREKIRKQARERVQRQFDLKKQEQEFIEFYRS